MNNRYYRCFDISEEGNRKCTTSMLLTNVTGYVQSDTPFETERVRNDFYVMYVVEGELVVVEGDTETVAVPGDMIFYREGDYHHYRKTDRTVFRYYWIHFTGYSADEIMKTCGFAKSGIYHVGLSEKVIKCFDTHFSDFYGQPIVGTHLEIIAAAHLMEIFSTMRSVMEANSTDSSSAKLKVYSSAKFINENYHTPLTVEQLASQQGLCEGYYSKVFTKYIGVSPQNYIIRVRMQNACMLLQHTDLTIARIAPSVGYDDPLYFSRIFRKNTGTSPVDYRKKHRSNIQHE